MPILLHLPTISPLLPRPANRKNRKKLIQTRAFMAKFVGNWNAVPVFFFSPPLRRFLHERVGMPGQNVVFSPILYVVYETHATMVVEWRLFFCIWKFWTFVTSGPNVKLFLFSSPLIKRSHYARMREKNPSIKKGKEIKGSVRGCDCRHHLHPSHTERGGRLSFSASDQDHQK